MILASGARVPGLTSRSSPFFPKSLAARRWAWRARRQLGRGGSGAKVDPKLLRLNNNAQHVRSTVQGLLVWLCASCSECERSWAQFPQQPFVGHYPFHVMAGRRRSAQRARPPPPSPPRFLGGRPPRFFLAPQPHRQMRKRNEASTSSSRKGPTSENSKD